MHKFVGVVDKYAQQLSLDPPMLLSSEVYGSSKMGRKSHIFSSFFINRLGFKKQDAQVHQNVLNSTTT